MGNHISHRLRSATGKVILSDGTIHEYNEKSLTVAELMLEYPQHVVVEFQSAMNETRLKPLAADNNLEIDKVYLMLPMKPGKPATLPSEEARRLLLMANSVLKSKYFLSSSSSSSGFVPLFARICSSSPGEGQRFVQKRKENLVEKKEEMILKTEYFNEVLEGRPEYLSRQFSGKVWKPSLDTIRETILEKKVTHWLF